TEGCGAEGCQAVAEPTRRGVEQPGQTFMGQAFADGLWPGVVIADQRRKFFQLAAQVDKQTAGLDLPDFAVTGHHAVHAFDFTQHLYLVVTGFRQRGVLVERAIPDADAAVAIATGDTGVRLERITDG